MKSSALTIPVALGIAAVALTACSSAGADESNESGLPVVNAGSLTVCISKNAYEPLYWHQGAELTGFDVDASAAIAEDLGLEVTFVELAFDGLIPGLDAGRCDLLRSGLYVSEERTKVADAIPYMVAGPGLILTEETSDAIESAEDLAGMTIAVQGASANETVLLDLNAELETAGLEPITLQKYPELPETVAALENGRVDATIETDVAAVQAAKTLGDEYTSRTDVFDADTFYGMYLPKDSELFDPVLASAQKLTEDGTFAELAEEYGLDPERLAAPDAE